MNLVVFPAETLRDANPSPFLLRQKSQCSTVIGIEELFRNHLEERLRENDMAVLVEVIGIAVGIVNPVGRSRE